MNFGVLGAVSAFLSVLAGAFGAHALRQHLSPDLLQAFETGARYQMFHALGLLLVELARPRASSSSIVCAGWLFTVGTALFSGSLYALALTGSRWLGAVTPFGGLAFLAGWLFFARALWTKARPG